MSKPFQYTPLDVNSNAIRLITIRPASAENPSRLDCSLVQTSLDDHPEYHALSYAWQDDAVGEQLHQSRGITVNGGSLKVGCNLAAALSARRDRGYEHIPIWIDAICINQEDIAERNDQILRMRHIYAQASLVTVWLGPERDNSHTAFEFIHTISHQGESVKEWLTDSLSTRKHSEEWHALDHMLRRSWWRRIWIIQEMVAAKEVFFFCGTLSISPMDISHCLNVLSTHQRIQGPLLLKHEGIILDYGTFSLAPSYLRQMPWKDNSILQTLYKTGLALSSDPKDKVFAILNLASDGVKVVPHPDYNLSTVEVYTQLVINIIQKTNRLDILSLAGLIVYERKLEDQLPTWVPDFSHRATSTINSSISSLRPVAADGGSSASVSFNHRTSTLTARGFLVDVVDGLAHVLGPSNSSNENGLQQSNSRHIHYYDCSRAIDGITQSLIAGSIPPMRSLNKEILQEVADRFVKNSREFFSNPTDHFDSRAQTLADWYRYNQDLIVSGKSIKQWTHGYISPTLSTLQPGEFFDYRWLRHWSSRRFLTTAAGYVGLGGNSCKPGDIICILLGCSTPLVLRSMGEAFQLVGEAYLHGLMDGEALKGIDSGKYSMRDFGIL